METVKKYSVLVFFILEVAGILALCWFWPGKHLKEASKPLGGAGFVLGMYILLGGGHFQIMKRIFISIALLLMGAGSGIYLVNALKTGEHLHWLLIVGLTLFTGVVLLGGNTMAVYFNRVVRNYPQPR